MLKLSRRAAELLIPDGTSWEAASARVTHLLVAARADDVELIAWHALSAVGARLVCTHNPMDFSNTSCFA